jgi:hypothetical protein
MIVYLWVMAALGIFAGLANVLMIGKPRKPTTPGAAVIALIINAAFSFGLIYAALHLNGGAS